MTGRALLAAGDPALAPSTDLAVAVGHLTAVPAAGPDGPGQEASRARVLDLIARHPDALERTCEPGHITGSGMVIDPMDRRFLMILHAKLRIWVQPGGHADGDTCLPGVALRESTEETGVAGLRIATPAIDIDIHPVPPPHGPHLHYDVRYLVVAPPGAAPARNHESLDIRWLAYDDLPAYDVDDGTLRLARAALAAFDDLRSAGVA